MKTLIEMIKEACDHNDINMSLEDMEFLVTGVPTDIPWSEDGMDFITGMVMGWDSYERRKKARKDFSQYKYVLMLNMNSDDDAEIQYDGNKYCFYCENLRITKGFDSLQEVKNFILNKIVVTPGFKATDFTKTFLAECCEFIDEGEFPFVHSYSGNQEYEFELDMNF